MNNSSVPEWEELYRERFAESGRLYQQSCEIFPSGVTHDGRYLTPFPPFVKSANGSRKTTVEGHEIIDYWSGHGALLLGHSHPAVVKAVQEQMPLGTHWGACHELEIEWGEWVRKLIPSAEQVRFTSSGTETTLMALRIARMVTGRNTVLKFAGHFHGWHDQLIPGADPPYGEEYTSPGVTPGICGDLVVAPPNDLNELERLLKAHRPACVILEPTGGHWGRVPMSGEFLRELRRLTELQGVLLIFDEVITGFRVAPGGAQAYYNIQPDLTTLAKILAGGLPGGALAGRKDLMDRLSFSQPPGQKMPHYGTYNANPLSAAAGCAALEIVAQGEVCEKANAQAEKLRRGLNEMFQRHGWNWIAYGEFSIVKIVPEYTGEPLSASNPIPYGNDYRKLDPAYPKSLTHAFRCGLLLGGVDWMGWGGLLCSEHSDEDIAQTIRAFEQTVAWIKNS